MSAIKNLVEEYANLVFPHDPECADRLAERIFLGEIEMSVEALVHETARLTGRGSLHGTLPGATAR